MPPDGAETDCRQSPFPFSALTTDVSEARNPDERENGRRADAQQGNWIAKNLWMLKGFLAALALAVFGVAVLFAFDGAMANVVWAMSVTLAALVVLVQLGIGVVQATRSV